MDLDFDNWVAVISIAIPSLAFFWEFAVVGRKRLGYRVQMDALAADATQSPYAGVLRDMQRDGHRLKDPSFVLLRIENAGSAPIEDSDYLTRGNDPCGITVTFRDRQVAGLVVTHLSQPELETFFTPEDEGFGYRNVEEGDLRRGVVRLPKAKLPLRAEYKVLVVLERWTDDDTGEPFPRPVFVGAVGGPRRWFEPLVRYFRFKLARTESHVFASRPAWIGIGLLALAVVAQSVTLFLPENRTPLDCVGGTLHLNGSTAFAPAVREAAARYEEACQGADVSIPIDEGTFDGSGEGLADLEKAGRDRKIEVGDGLGDHITFADGIVGGDHARVLSRAIAYSVFTLVVNKDAGVGNLTSDQIRRLYAGKITNWSQLGGEDVPVHLVNRHVTSGTRSALVARVLNRKQPLGPTVENCAALEEDTYGICEVDSTQTMLETVAAAPGALGYSEVSSAAAKIKEDEHLVQLPIASQRATLDAVENGDYPYWQTEFAYTYGEPPAGSVAAAFLTYLTDQGGRDVLREYGNRLCSEVENPYVCEPT
ncbi:PstS family phosphate ABC transporter substrate-binding protein [Streptomyces lincolnensis]|uniref:PstS family phosphate ABC transporter substrate-binding protein n=1 Tax=Streptomyces lincolnensis TaxID=1915 RepID=UPI0037D18AE9